jgi:tetratricopeptide (TPR) repeat protein
MITRSRRPAIIIVFLAVLLALSGVSASVRAAEPAEQFPGYPKEVAQQAERVLDSAKPGNESQLKTEVRQLGKKMHARAILSINVLPEKVFLKAKKDGWGTNVTESMRILSEAAPLSVPLWAWLFKEDVVHFRVADAFRDFSGIAGAIRRFGPALMGYGAWLVTYIVALSCWFTAWASICLFMRGRPSLEADLKRLANIPYRDFITPIVAVLIFVLPLALGFGLAVSACIWLAVSTVYLRRGELVIMTAAVLMMAGIVLGGGILSSLDQLGGNTRKGGWLGGEGYIPMNMPSEGAPVQSSDAAWMLEFARARLDMQTGKAVSAERRFNEIVESGKGLPEVYNNRGIARAIQGRTREALLDFEAARAKRPDDGPSLWNAYQIYLQTFNLEKASAIQNAAWAGIQNLQPYGFRPSEFEQGEWIASGMPVGEIWMAFVHGGADLIRDAGKSDVFHKFFKPLSPFGALFFLGMAYVWSMVWKAASLKLWVNCTCRVCGSRAMIIASRETSDVCTPCRAQIGGGIRAGEERDRRVQGIMLHRRFVRLASIFLPGAGVLWAGKEIRAFIYGLFLSASLAGITTSLGIAQQGNPIVYQLQRSVLIFFLTATAFLWGFGILWSFHSFKALQRRYNIIGEG